jgi:iron complex outermembrane recepter protein
MFRKRILASAIAATLSPFTITAFAQNEPERSIEVVIVTAERVEKSILDISTTINILDAEFIEQENLRELNQVANFLPNVLVQEQAVSGQSFTIRGLGDEDGEQKLGSFFNGLNVTDRNFSGQFMHDVQRVEVLKGPQTTAFGSFAVNGAINVVSKRADLEGFEGSVGAGIGSFDETRLEGVINVPVTDWLAVRLAGFTVDKDGYSENLNGEDQNARVGDNLRFTASAEFERFSGDFIVAYEENDGPGIGFKSKYFLPEGGTASASDPLDFGGNATTIQREMTLYQLKTQYDFTDAISLNYNLYYNDGDLYEYYDVDGGPGRIDERDYAYRSEFTGNELFLTYKHDRFDVLVGYNDLRTEQVYDFFRFYADLQDRTAFEIANATVVGETPFDSLSDDSVYPAGFPIQDFRQQAAGIYDSLAPVTVDPVGIFVPPGSPVPAGVNLLFDASAALQPLDNTTNGYFINVEFDISDKLSVNAGVRDEETESNGVRDSEAAALWKFGANYAVSDTLSVYYSYAEGATPARGTVLVGENLQRETIDSHDLGFYWVSGNFKIQAAYFTYDYDNLVVGIDDPVTSLPSAVNYGEASVSGFELQGDYQITNNWGMFGSFGSNDAEYGRALGISETINYEGNQYRNSPELAYSLGVRFAASKLRSTLSWTWQDDVFFEASNDPDTLQESFGLLNFNIQYDISEKLTVGIYGKNILDEEYIIDAGNTAGSTGYPSLIQGTPANWLGTIRYTF